MVDHQDAEAAAEVVAAARPEVAAVAVAASVDAEADAVEDGEFGLIPTWMLSRDIFCGVPIMHVANIAESNMIEYGHGRLLLVLKVKPTHLVSFRKTDISFIFTYLNVIAAEDVVEAEEVAGVDAVVVAEAVVVDAAAV